MKARQLINLGIPKGQVMKIAQDAVMNYVKAGDGKVDKQVLIKTIDSIVKQPADYFVRWMGMRNTYSFTMSP